MQADHSQGHAAGGRGRSATLRSDRSCQRFAVNSGYGATYTGFRGCEVAVDTPRSTRDSSVMPADWAATIAAGAACVAIPISIRATIIANRGVRWQRDAADSARRSADAAERANLLTERTLSGDRPPTRAESQERVAWRVERHSSNRFVLRNTGTIVAEHVSIDDVGDGLVGGLPEDAVVHAGEGVDFLIAATFGNPVPNQVYVQWGEPGSPFRQAVPMPTSGG